MPRVDPLPTWLDEEVYIVGGGSSLRYFDWSQLIRRCTIGCNHAYELGPEVTKVCTFGDYAFWSKHKSTLGAFGGWVVTNYHVVNPPPWLQVRPRIDHGLARKTDRIAWNGNTGLMSIHLALLMGACTVNLLGFDMCRNGEGKSHWHDRPPCAPQQVQNEQTYTKFRNGLQSVIEAAGKLFPGVRIRRVTESRLHYPWLEESCFRDAGLQRPMLEALTH